MSLRTRTKRLFRQEAFEWVDRSYVTDWIVVIGIWILSWLVSTIPVFERDFSPRDPLIGHPHKKNQIGSALNHNISLWAPVLIVTILGVFRKSLIEIHHGIIAVFAGRGLARLITELMKHQVGRLRPDFLARCKWDVVLKACTGHPLAILDGRKSFPSGHSSTAYAGMTFLSLWLAGKTAAWCFHIPRPAAALRSSRMGSFFLTLLPLFWATFVAISRLSDYRHHKEDVIVGGLIGIISSTICYLLFWPNPFSARNFTPQLSGRPRVLYVIEEGGRSHVEFELTQLGDDEMEAV